MSYTIMIPCGCTVYVACHPANGFAHTRVIERLGDRCHERMHHVGARVFLWELLPRSSEVDDVPQVNPARARRPAGVTLSPR